MSIIFFYASIPFVLSKINLFMFELLGRELTKNMKKDIHPKYYPATTIKCACGAILETGATKENIEVEICSQCHPYFTGDKKVVDTAGRVERFKKLAEASAKLKSAKKAKKETKLAKEKKTSPKKVTKKK